MRYGLYTGTVSGIVTDIAKDRLGAEKADDRNTGDPGQGYVHVRGQGKDLFSVQRSFPVRRMRIQREKPSGLPKSVSVNPSGASLQQENIMRQGVKAASPDIFNQP